MIIVSYAAGGAVEVLFAAIRKEEINEGFLVTGLLYPLILPPTLPLWMVALGVAFGVTVGKEIFGGTGRNLFNPALVGRCFLFMAYPSAMGGTCWIDPAGNASVWGGFTQWLNVDAITGSTPLGLVAKGELTPLWDLWLGNVPGSLGATSSLAIIVGGVFLLLTKVANYRVTVGMLGSFAALGGILSATGQFGPIGFHLLAGGLLFGAFFMATDPVSAPSTNPARWMYGILIGVLTVLMRKFTPLPEGVMFSVLLGNIFAPILDEIVIRLRMRRIAREK
jgi:Na(+)-translocating NADH:ubiquinone oxidoreductase B subunit